MCGIHSSDVGYEMTLTTVRQKLRPVLPHASGTAMQRTICLCTAAKFSVMDPTWNVAYLLSLQADAVPDLGWGIYVRNHVPPDQMVGTLVLPITELMTRH